MAKDNKTCIDATVAFIEKVIKKIGSGADDEVKKPKSYKKDDSITTMNEKEFMKTVDKFTEMTYGGFCKDRDLDKNKKKSIRKYCEYISKYLPIVAVYVRYIGSITNKFEKEKIENIIHKFGSDDYVEYIKKLIKNDDDKPEGLEYYPLIVGKILLDIDERSESEDDIPDNLESLVDISFWASKEIINKLSKKFDCPSDVGLTIMMSIPTRDMYEDLPASYLKRKAVASLIDDLISNDSLNEAIVNKKIPDFSDVFKYMNIPVSSIIPQILVTNIREGDSALALNSLTDWALDTLNVRDDEDMEYVIKNYCFAASKIQGYEPRIIFSELPSQYIKLRNAATRILNNEKFKNKGFDKILK